MPMYEFECDECGKIIDKIVKFSEADNNIVCDCADGAEMHRIDKIYRSGQKYHGIWWKTSKAY